jgi:hypothetical protein
MGGRVGTVRPGRGTGLSGGGPGPGPGRGPGRAGGGDWGPPGRAGQEAGAERSRGGGGGHTVGRAIRPDPVARPDRGRKQPCKIGTIFDTAFKLTSSKTLQVVTSVAVAQLGVT